MQQLVASNKEPITPFVQKILPLYRDLGVSCILVMGGSGDYFDVADAVIVMDCYRVHDYSQQARQIAQKFPSNLPPDTADESFGSMTARIPTASSLNAWRGNKENVKVPDREKILFGVHHIDLSA